PEIPTTLTLPDGTSATPVLADAWVGECPVQPAEWQSAGLILFADGLLQPAAAGSDAAGGANVGFSPEQRQALLQYLVAGGQAVVVMAANPGPLNAAAWLHPAAPGQPAVAFDPSTPLPAARTQALIDCGLPPRAAAAFPLARQRCGFGSLTLAWLVPQVPVAAAAGPVAWQDCLAQRLNARDPHLQPQQRVDLEGYASVFDPQMALLPRRLIGQVWWYLALVSALLLLLGVEVLRRRPHDLPAMPPAQPVLPATPNVGKPGLLPPSALHSARLPAASRPAGDTRGWRVWFLAAGGAAVVAALASLYSARPRLAAIEWRFDCDSRDGRQCQIDYTYLHALRDVNDLRLELRTPPATSPSNAADPDRPIDGLPICANLEDMKDEPGRLSCRPAAPIEAYALVGYRPVLLESSTILTSTTTAAAPSAPSSSSSPAAVLPAPVISGLPAQLALPTTAPADLADCDWAVVLLPWLPAAGTPHLPTDFPGFVLLPPANEAPAVTAPAAAGTAAALAGWRAEPLWIHGAEPNLPASLQAQAALYSPAALRWIFSRVRQLTRAPVLIEFRRKALAHAAWRVGPDAPHPALEPVPLDDSLAIHVTELPAEPAPPAPSR
ncbi:MAG: hypothetical protein ACREJ2_11605, partial [Planctomycetota bacterium]